MPYFLVSLDERMRFSLSGPEEVYLVGRGEDCDIRLESRKVSRRHCCIAQVNDYLAVRDLASTNGIRVNGREVLESRLSHGDVLTIGPYNFRIIWQQENAGQRGPTSPQPKPQSAEPGPSLPVSGPRISPEAPKPPVTSSSPTRQPPVRQPSKPGSLLEDSRLFKLLESDDPLLGGGR